MSLARWCLSCPKVSPPPHRGVALCLYGEPVNIAERIKVRFCPLGRFPADESLIESQGYDPAIIKQGGCCDPPKPDPGGE